jgi:hypothetical protein
MKMLLKYCLLNSLLKSADPVELKAAFKNGTVLTDSDTVLHCVGIEFYNRAGTDGYALYSTGTMLLYDVF